MKILFVSRFLPHPDVRDSGGQDTYHYISALSAPHDVSLIAFTRPGQDDAVRGMQEICVEVVAVPYRQTALSHRLWRAWWRFLYPRVYGRVFSFTYRRQLRALLARHDFDVVLVEGVMAQYGTVVRGAKRVLDEVDIYASVAYQIYRNEERSVFRLYKWLDWLRLQAWELHYADSYDGVLVRSEADRVLLQRYLPEQKIGVLSPWFEGLDTLQNISACRPSGNQALFVGAMCHPENVEAVVYFVERVFPKIRRQVPDAEFVIVGSNPTRRVRALGRVSGVTVVGEVADLTPYYEQSAVNVVPLLRGGGIIVKTLNGLAAARPTVTTSAGNSGTEAIAGRDLLVTDDPDAFARAVIDLLTDADRWYTLAENGRQFVATAYRWNDIVARLEQFLRALQG